MKSRPKAFVLMPFRQPYDSYYIDIYKPAIEEMGYDVFRADDIYTPGPIMLDIQKAITETDIVFCEMSERSPNVFYELGLAHAVGKPVILVSRKEDDVPFDLRHIRVVNYDTIQVGWDKSLATSIKETIASLKSVEDVWPPPLVLKQKPSDWLLKRGDLGSFDERLENVETLEISFAIGNYLFHNFKTEIKKKWREGCRIKLLQAFDPDWINDNQLVRAFVYNHIDFADTADELSRLAATYSKFDEFTNESSNGGLVEIRRLNYFPTTSYMIVNREKENAYVKVEIYVETFDVSNTNRPHFLVYKNKLEDQDWYHFFVGIFDRLWADSISL